MEPVQNGDVLYCEECGVELSVTSSCMCSDDCEIICCGKPLKKRESEDSGGGCCCS